MLAVLEWIRHFYILTLCHFASWQFLNFDFHFSKISIFPTFLIFPFCLSAFLPFPDLVAMNAWGQIPVLQIDGLFLSESSAILEV